MKHFDKLSNDERIRRNKELDEHMTEVIHGLDKAGWIEEGKEQGRKEERIDLIFKMLEKGCSVLEISQMTDLSEKEILELKKSSYE